MKNINNEDGFTQSTMAPQVRPPVRVTDGHVGFVRMIYFKIHNMIMTPLIMISFLVSLAIIDLKYSIRRSSFHGDPSPPASSSSSSSGTNHTQQTTSWVPSWLERQLCKFRPYRYIVGCPPCEVRKRNDSEHHQHEPEQWNGIWGTSFYRTKQRTLMKMEAADAFEIRTKTLAALVVLSLFLLWCTWRLLSWVVCFIWSML